MNSKIFADNHYDLILIGSGIGALTIASLMAQLRDKKVLVIERHFRAGGYTHSFKRQNFYWDVGTHYLGMLDQGSPIRDLFDLVTGRQVQWTRMPDPFDVFVYPGFTFKLRSGKKYFISDLIQQFPKEEKAIRQYVHDIYTASTAYLLHVLQRSGSFLLNTLGFVTNLISPPPLNLSTKAYLDQHFRDEALKALLVSQWGDYGIPPSLSPFPLHATFVRHFIDGAYYPVGGGQCISDSVKSIVSKKGGRFLLNRKVTQLLIDNGQAVGVQACKVNAPQGSSVDEYYAPVIISNAGVANTYLNLVPQDYEISFREPLRRFLKNNPPCTSVSLYLGLSQDPRKLGFQGENHWLYAGIDHDQMYERRGEWIKDTKPSLAYLSFPSLKDPKAKGHTATILAWTDYTPFEHWRSQTWMKRDENYQRLKQHLSDALINFVDQHYPGFVDLVKYKELSTPITNEFFTGHHRGGIYGLPFVVERFKIPENADWSHPKTPIPGLFIAGTDVYMSGIVGSMIGSLITLALLPDGIPVRKVFALHKLK